MTKITINTPNGIGEVESVYESDLGFMMVRVYYPNEKRYTTFNVGKYGVEDNIFTNVISEKTENYERQ
jgi:hypothetical protein